MLAGGKGRLREEDDSHIASWIGVYSSVHARRHKRSHERNNDLADVGTRMQDNVVQYLSSWQQTRCRLSVASRRTAQVHELAYKYLN